AWVFPGGRIDAADYAAAGESTDVVAAAKHAAVREAREEAGINVAAENLVALSRWVTPVESPKRFDAWFFATRAGEEAVQIAGSEIHAHRWSRPHDALAAHRSGEIDLPPPTWVTLHWLSAYAAVEAVLEAARHRPLEVFEPRIYFAAQGACSLY